MQFLFGQLHQQWEYKSLWENLLLFRLVPHPKTALYFAMGHRQFLALPQPGQDQVYREGQLPATV